MAHDKLSISLPPGYQHSLDVEAARYGFTRSEFVRVLFDAYLTVVAAQVMAGEQESRNDPTTGLPDFFPDVFPHRKAEANRWLHDYQRIAFRVAKEREDLKKKTGSVDQDSVSGDLVVP